MANALSFCSLFVALSLWAFLISPTQSLNCTSPKFTTNRVYTNCTELSTLNSYLHFTYNASNSSLSIAFVSTPAKSDGWVAWAINPTATGMIGAQAFIAFKSNGSIVVHTYNLTSYGQITQQNLSFAVWDLSAESNTNGSIVIFGSVKVPENVEKLNQVWQVGATVTNGMPMKHDMASANLMSKGLLQLVGSAAETPTPTPAPAPTAGGGAPGPAKSGVSRIGEKVNVGLILGLVFLIGTFVAF